VWIGDRESTDTRMPVSEPVAVVAYGHAKGERRLNDLDAHLVEHAIEHLPLDEIDVLFIENVGNMVCPTDFRLGAEKRIVIVSSTEGDDVVNKHPMMFRGSTIGVINKIDLAGFVGADLDRMERDMHRYNPEMQVFKTNMKTGEGLEALLDAILA